jgi:hypothetical protein
VVVVGVDVSTCVTVTVTPGILDPEGSETVPTIPPVVNWARTSGWLNPNNAIAQTRTLALKQVRFVMTWLPSRHVAMPSLTDTEQPRTP